MAGLEELVIWILLKKIGSDSAKEKKHQNIAQERTGHEQRRQLVPGKVS